VNAKRLWELVRFYQAAAVNAVFGFSLYSLLVYAGVNLFAAQLIGHCIGMAFNYVTYSRYAFRDHKADPKRFVASYVVNYFIGLGFLALFHSFVASPYIAGIMSLVATSVVNYAMLKFAVFREADVH